MYIYIYIYTYIYIYVCVCVCVCVCVFMYIYRAGFKKRKVIRNFCVIATRFGKVIRNCES